MAAVVSQRYCTLSPITGLPLEVVVEAEELVVDVVLDAVVLDEDVVLPVLAVADAPPLPPTPVVVDAGDDVDAPPPTESEVPPRPAEPDELAAPPAPPAPTGSTGSTPVAHAPNAAAPRPSGTQIHHALRRFIRMGCPCSAALSVVVSPTGGQ
jgi:hypothetical protein